MKSILRLTKSKTEPCLRDELDHILLSQLICAKRQLRNVKRMKKIFYDPVNLSIVEHRIMGRMAFYESMIVNKSLIKKKRVKQERVEDILARNIIETYYRHLFVVSLYFYSVFSGYFSIWRRK